MRARRLRGWWRAPLATLVSSVVLSRLDFLLIPAASRWMDLGGHGIRILQPAAALALLLLFHRLLLGPLTKGQAFRSLLLSCYLLLLHGWGSLPTDLGMLFETYAYAWWCAWSYYLLEKALGLSGLAALCIRAFSPLCLFLLAQGWGEGFRQRGAAHAAAPPA